MQPRLAPVLLILGLSLSGCHQAELPLVHPPLTTTTTLLSSTTTQPVTTTTTTTATTATTGELTWGLDATLPSVSWTKPGLGDLRTDPAYRTPVRRLTSADDTRFDRNPYSRRQAENADGTMFMTYHGDAVYRVYRRATSQLVSTLDIHPDAELQWHPTDPDRIRHILGPNSYVGDLRYYELDISTGADVVIADLTDRIQAMWPTARYMIDRAEGSPSADGNRVAWVVYDADLGNGRQINAKTDHSDIALSVDGRDTYVYIDFSAGPDGGWLMAVDLANLERTALFDLYDNANTSIHISGTSDWGTDTTDTYLIELG